MSHAILLTLGDNESVRCKDIEEATERAKDICRMGTDERIQVAIIPPKGTKAEETILQRLNFDCDSLDWVPVGFSK